MVGCGPSWPVGDQIHIPLHRPQERQRRSAVTLFRLDARQKFAREPGHKFPSQAGTSCEAGTSTARTWDGQPSPSGVAPGARACSDRAESTPVSRRSQHPNDHLKRRARRAFGTYSAARPASEPHSAPAGIAAPARLTLTRSQEPERAPQPQAPQPIRQASLCRQNPTPLDCSHLVSAHPPCSRKGPLLPACGLKCPRRVKRETTNSRFFRFKGTLAKFWWIPPHKSGRRLSVPPRPPPHRRGAKQAGPQVGRGPGKKKGRRAPAGRAKAPARRRRKKPQHPGFPCGPPPWY